MMPSLAGRRVRLSGLSGRAELNGRHGLAISFNEAKGRWVVRLDGSSEKVLCKTGNLEELESTESQGDKPAIARFIAAFSLRVHPDTAMYFTAEVKRGGVSLGSWCCPSSSLWCAGCGHNYLWSSADEEVADNISTLLRLPRADAMVDRKFPGELEAALALLERVAAGRKPLGQLVLDNFGEREQQLLRSEAARQGLLAVQYTNSYQMNMLGVCVRGRRVEQIADLEALARLFGRAGLAEPAAEIERVRHIRRSPALGPDALVSRYITRFDVEDTRMGWLTGILLGYPVWTTIARYHSGALQPQSTLDCQGCG